MSRSVTIVRCRVGEEPRLEEASDELEALQALVGGFLEAVPVLRSVFLYLNENGALEDLPRNRRGTDLGVVTVDGWLRGDFFFTAHTGAGGLRSLRQNEIDEILELLEP